MLDFVFAQWFFVYPNLGATLGIPARALGKAAPVEEYIFYLTGFLAVLLLYVWLGLAVTLVSDPMLIMLPLPPQRPAKRLRS